MGKIAIKILGSLLSLVLFLILPSSCLAVVLVSQTTNYSTSLDVWQVLQELGTNLSGTVKSFTFRVSTVAANNQQFDFTAINTRLYDKTTGTYIIACTPPGSSSDRLAGLTFTTSKVPSGYEDVTFDFSCRNYTFINGHRYLIFISNANCAQCGGLRMRVGSATYSGTGNDYFTGGGLRYAFDNGSCNGTNYVWNSSTNNSGCNIFTNKNDDIYFKLEDNSPTIDYPVVFIPGIGGSELQTASFTNWSLDNGHGGTYTHTYPSGEKVWVNSDEAIKLGDDDYFDILKLKSDGVTPEANLSLTGNLTSYGYSDIDPFFQGMGYTKNNNYFIFNYDWRKDIRETASPLDTLIETAKAASGKSRVDIVSHSMGGLIARNYISDPSKASKVNKLVELGVPHLGTADGLKAVIYGKPLGRQIIGEYYLGIPASEGKDVSQNFPSVFQLIPSKKYFDFYSPSIDKSLPYPFWDDRDIDNNGITGYLNYGQTKTLLSNLKYNNTVFNLAETFHNGLDTNFSQTNNVKVYEIVGNNQPTLGQIIETYYIVWPFNALPKKDELYINGDGTVPLYSASLKSDLQDLSGAYKIYYVDQQHSDLVSQSGTAMQTVKSILNETNVLPVQVKDQKITLEGRQVSVDQDASLDLYDENNNHTGLNSSGDVETNISGTFYDSLNSSRHIFIKKSASKVKAKVKSTKISKVKIKVRNYSSDKISKTIFYNDIPITSTSTLQFDLDPTLTSAPTMTVDNQTYTANYEAQGTSAIDQTPPTTTITIDGTKDVSGNYDSFGAKVTLAATDSESGILKTEYSLDNGTTVQTYTGPLTVTTSGTNTLLVKSTDNLGNEEKTQTTTISISAISNSSSSSSSSSNSSSSSSSNSSSSSSDSSTTSISNSKNRSLLEDISSTKVLGVSFQNPTEPKSAVTEILAANSIPNQSQNLEKKEGKPDPILNWILMVTAGTLVLGILALGTTFVFRTTNSA